MKLKALAGSALTHYVKLMYRKTENGGMKQYVGIDGMNAIYTLEEDMPLLNEESLLVVMDIPMDKRGKWTVVIEAMDEEEQALVADANAEEKELHGGRVGYGVDGCGLLTAWDGENAHFFLKNYLKPLEDMKDYQYMRMVLRGGKGRKWIAVLEGMQHRATILPIEAIQNAEALTEMMHIGKTAAEMLEGLSVSEENIG